MIGFEPSELEELQQYKIMTGCVVPRPIGFITTKGPQGVNAAPFSMFNVVGTEPPMVMFCAGDQDDGTGKDTVQNIEANPEFVAHIVSEDIAEQMNICSADYPMGVNELEKAGLTEVPSVKVSVPRIKESPVHFECKFDQSLRLGSRHHMHIGEVVYIHLREDIVDMEKFYINIEKLKPVGRLSGPRYAHINDIFTMTRPYLNDNAVKRN
ncbi:MAG: flavin reductase family protein [Rhodospirillaceae bacterium]